jgi:hypothetical protein
MQESESSTESDLVKALTPADTCSICGRRHEEIGGKRLVGQKGGGIRVVASEKNPGGRKHHPVPGRPGLWVAIYGEPGLLRDEVRDHVLAQLEQGLRPWFCQECAHLTCHECGAILRIAPGADYLADDNGKVVHSPMLAANPGCANPSCRLYRPDSNQD